MRLAIAIIAALLVVTNAGSPHSAVAQSAAVDGQVTKVDPKAGKVTLRHGPIKNFDMDSMTMVFRVVDPTMLDKVKVGDKVKFEADRVNGAITITKMEKSK